MSLRLIKVLLFLVAASASSSFAACVSNTTLVPGAECRVRWDLADLATPFLSLTAHTDPSDWATLHSRSTKTPLTIAPGVQIDGYFNDTSASNTCNGWPHD